MFKIRLFFAVLAALLVLAACAVPAKPIYSKPTENNKDYKIEYLFEHEGCKVYRFSDMGNWVYFTNCNGETITSDSTKTTRNRTERKN